MHLFACLVQFESLSESELTQRLHGSAFTINGERYLVQIDSHPKVKQDEEGSLQNDGMTDFRQRTLHLSSLGTNRHRLTVLGHEITHVLVYHCTYVGNSDHCYIEQEALCNAMGSAIIFWHEK